MTRRLLFQLASPAVLIGLLLFGVCLVAGWSLHRLQKNLAQVLADNVAGLEAAQELEIQLRQLRFHAMLYAMDPTPARLDPVQRDQAGFEAALEKARQAAHKDAERNLVQAIETGYREYRAELTHATPPPASGRAADYVAWSDAHHVSPLQIPCEELLRLNKAEMEATARESDTLSRQAQFVLLLLGLAGPAAGLLAGYGIARGLGRSLLRAEQLAAVGRLAASVAHEVRNPLTAIKLLVESGLRSQRKPLTSEDLTVIHGEVVRLERTVQNLLDFARPADLSAHKGLVGRVTADLRDVVAHALTVVRTRTDQQGVLVEVRQLERPVTALVDPDQMGSVLVNLFLNALDVMPGGGRLSVKLEEIAGHHPQVRLQVSDTGPGISRSMLGRLFTPFASTKPTGTGLGLSICRRIVEEHGGRMSAHNGPDGGAVFEVILPSGEPNHVRSAGD
jgi:signal transduction histidine kinase